MTATSDNTNASITRMPRRVNQSTSSVSSAVIRTPINKGM